MIWERANEIIALIETALGTSMPLARRLHRSEFEALALRGEDPVPISVVPREEDGDPLQSLKASYRGESGRYRSCRYTVYGCARRGRLLCRHGLREKSRIRRQTFDFTPSFAPDPSRFHAFARDCRIRAGSNRSDGNGETRETRSCFVAREDDRFTCCATGGKNA